MKKYYRVITLTEHDYELDFGCFADMSKAILLADILSTEINKFYKEICVYEIDTSVKFRRRSVYHFIID